MSATPIALSVKDNATTTLASDISASTLSIPLATGGGASFPQPYSGTCTSLGSATLLNSTGISAAVGGSAVEGKLIWNRTDGSVARITTGGVAANAVTTTRLLGGTTNVWNNADQWVIDPFVATFEKISTSAYGVQSTTQQEEALIIARATDTLTVASGSRGYNSTTANTFATGDYVRVNVTAPVHERLKDVLSVLAVQVNTNVTGIATNGTDIDSIESNATFYVAAAGSANAFTGTLANLPAAYTTGERLIFKANHTITGSATFNRASLGAKTIKKLDGATNLASGDIQNGQLVEIQYDGTNYQMLSPVGQPTAGLTNLGTVTAASADVGASSTAENTIAPTWTGTNSVPANSLAVGSVVKVRLSGNYTLVSGQVSLRLKVGGTFVTAFHFNVADTQAFDIDVEIDLRSSPGAAATLIGRGHFVLGKTATGTPANAGASRDSGDGGISTTFTADTTGALAVTLTAQYSASNGGHACNIQAGSIKVYNAP